LTTQLAPEPHLADLIGAAPARSGVYVHVPFCSHRCDYCAFATWTGLDDLWERYALACAAQAKALAGASGPPVISVFFGGGTPSLLPAELLVMVLDAVRDSFAVVPGAEVTVECNPETVTVAKLEAYRRAGVSRLSFGAQSMVPHVLGSLGRRHQPGAVRRAAWAAGEAGFTSYNVDLIFGAVGESLDDWRASLEEVVGLAPAPAHVSAYALTVEPGTALAGDRARHPDDDDQADKYLLADALLESAGYEWYEISNWARPGHRCDHNTLYWSQGDCAGIGCSAHSHKVLADGSARRWWNVRTPERYCQKVEAGQDVEAAGEVLPVASRLWEALVLGLRTSAGVPASSVPDELFEEGLVALAGGAPQSAPSAPSAPGPGLAASPKAVLTLRGRLLANEVSLRLKVPGAGH